MTDKPTLGTFEAKRYTGLTGEAWEAFCERTNLVKIPNSDKYNRWAIDIALELDGYGAIAGHTWTEESKYLELIPPTDEQLIKQLEDAGFVPIKTDYGFLFEFKRDNLGISVNSDSEVILDQNGRGEWIPCRDFAGAVELALTLKRVME